MFLTKNYVLANELVQKMGIHIANISMLRKKLEDNDDFTTIVNMNSCNFIKTNSNKLPNNILSGIASNEFTDMSNKLPVTYVRSEYGITERELNSCGVITGKQKIGGKDFYVFTDEFVQKVQKKIVYILDEQETKQCMDKKQIEGFIKLSKNKFITWYSIYG